MPPEPGPPPDPRRPGLWPELLDLVWPSACPGCRDTGAGTAPACPACLRAFRVAPSPTEPTPSPAWMPKLWAVTDYAGSARAVLLAYKERGGRRLAGPLGEALAAGLDAALAATDWAGAVDGGAAGCLVVPMPSSAAARRSRGGDPTLRMTQIAVRRLRAGNRAVGLLPALSQRAGVLDSAGLSAQERIRNLAGALRVRPAARPWLAAASVVLLADDIVTTGATLAEANRVLLGLQVPVSGAAVVAATERRLGDELCAPGAPATTVSTWRPPGSVVAPGTSPASRCQPQAKRPT